MVLCFDHLLGPRSPNSPTPPFSQQPNASALPSSQIQQPNAPAPHSRPTPVGRLWLGDSDLDDAEVVKHLCVPSVQRKYCETKRNEMKQSKRSLLLSSLSIIFFPWCLVLAFVGEISSAELGSIKELKSRRYKLHNSKGTCREGKTRKQVQRHS